MSVRDFQNHPCPVCKSDTLHLAMVCRTCGNKQVHPHEQFENRETKAAAPMTRQSRARTGIYSKAPMMRAVEKVARRRGSGVRVRRAK